MTRSIHIDPDWLREQYEVLGRTYREIADDIGCSRRTVNNRAIEFGIKSRPCWYVSCRPKSLEHRRKISESNKGKHDHFGENNPHYGKKHTEEALSKIRASRSKQVFSEESLLKRSRSMRGKLTGDKNPAKRLDVRKKIAAAQRGKTISAETRKKISMAIRGKNHYNWKGGVSRDPYCYKFNASVKERVREAFGRECFLCGKNEDENGKHLDVHHVDYNKSQGCGQYWNLVPLCVSCHARTSSNRWYWFSLLGNYWTGKYLPNDLFWGFP